MPFVKGHKINVGRPSGMLGKHHTEEVKRKISETLKGGKAPWAHGLPIGFKHSKKSILKMSESHKKNPTRYWLGKKLLPHVIEAHSSALRGRPSWNKGKGTRTKLTAQIKNTVKYVEWRKKVFERDNWICQECLVRGGKLHPHHIRPFSIILKENKIKKVKEAEMCQCLWNINNGITFCESCHRKTSSWGVNAKFLAIDILGDLYEEEDEKEGRPDI